MTPATFLLGALLGAPAGAQDTPAATFFLLERSVRAEGMGGAFAAVSEEVEGMFGNPAASARGPAGAFAGGSLRRVDDGSVSFASLGARWSTERGALGAAASYLSVGVDGYDETGNPAAGASESDLSLRALWSRRFRGGALGVSPKLLRTTLDASRTVTLDAFAVDAGIVWALRSGRGARAGLVLQNAGPDADGFPLPTRVAAGWAGHFGDDDAYLFAADAAGYLGGFGGVELAAGVEHRSDAVALRAGLRLHRTGASGAGVSPTVGLGWGGPRWGFELAAGLFDAKGDALDARASFTWRFEEARR